MGADDNDGESPWESATNDQAFRETVSVAGGRQQATGEISDNERSVSSSPAVTSVVRWELEEDNSNDINGNNNQNANDVSFLTSETITNTNAAAATTTTTNANSLIRRRGRGNEAGGGTEERSASDCFSKLSLKHIIHLWDIILTLFWMIFIGYHLYYNKDNEPSRSTSMAILLVICCVLAILNLLRGLLWLWTTLPSLSTICCCGCFFNNDDDNESNNPSNVTVYKLSTNLTLSIGIAYGITAGIGWFGPSSSNWLPWCDGLTSSWCTTLPTKFMPIVLTISSIIELLRWIFLLGRLSSLEITTSIADRRRSPDYYNDEHERNDYNAASPSETSRHRPWWWNRRGGGGSVSSNNNNNELHESLLDSTRNGDDVVGGGGQPTWTTMSSWIPFSPSSRQRQRQQERNNNNTNNAIDTGGGTDTTGENNRSTSSPILNGDEDDVESVLDSLGEDWASRTEDDPNWWTR